MRTLVTTAACIMSLVAGTMDPMGLHIQIEPSTEPAAAGETPARPREKVNTSDVRPTGRRLRVAAGDDLQKAIDDARAGDHLVLEAGATYEGPFRIPKKDGAGWIVVTTSALNRLPPGKRVHPSDAVHMPKLRAAERPVFETAAGAHHYRFVGLDIAPREGSLIRNLVQIGGDESNADDVPHHIVIDRSYLHGDATLGTRRGVVMNARHAAVINSYLSDFKEAGADSQAVAGWNGPGPFAVINNYLEAAGENVMFGGADPSIPDLVPSDIEISRNHFTKPLEWRRGSPEFRGTPWTVKNLLELKNARRVVVDGNLLEHNWPDGQNGFAVLFTPRNQDGHAPWSVVEDVVFVNNVVRHAANGINILGHDDIHPSRQARRIALRNNLFFDVGGMWGPGHLVQLLGSTRNIVIDHNTAVHNGTLLSAEQGPHIGFVFQNNIALHNEYGIHGSGVGSGIAALQKLFPGSMVRRNLLIGADARQYPPDNFFPGALSDAGTIRDTGDGYRVTLARRYAGKATDGRDPGANIAALNATLKRVVSAPQRRVSQIERAPAVAREGSFAAPMFWGALMTLAYVYIGYPLVAWARAKLTPACHTRAAIEPTVTVIIVVHDEATRIEARIENLLALDYPRDKLEIIVGSDGSHDDTVQRARRFARAGVTIASYPEHRGKSAVLNDLVPRASGDIVIFGDARQRFAPDVVRVLVSHFADPDVGAVSGELLLAADPAGSSAAQGTAFYWRYEKFIRLQESRVASTVGASGSIYAIRRRLFERVPSDTVLDDVVIPLRLVRRGYRVLYEPDAKAFDRASDTGRQEYVRKVRTIGGTFQLFARERWLLSPLQNPLWFQTISHKGLRLTIPLLHTSLFVANLGLVREGFVYRLLMGGQVVFYAAGFSGHLLRRAPYRPRILTVPYAMCLLCWATVGGFVRFVTHRQHVGWERAYPVARISAGVRT